MAEEFIARPVQKEPSSVPPGALLEAKEVKQLQKTQNEAKTRLSSILSLLKNPFDPEGT